MAEPEANPLSENVRDDDEKKLKYLDFVQVAAIYSIVCFSSLYEYAKENAGPLQLGVQSVEDSVRTVLGPLYEGFHDVPFEFLKFVDGKVDNVFRDLEKFVPSLVKEASSQARAAAAEVQATGVVDAVKGIVRSMCKKYEPVAAKYAVAAWRSLNRLPLFPEVADIVVPTAAYWSEKYNQAVRYAGDRGYPVLEYLPLIPIEKIAEVFEKDGSGPSASSTSEKIMIAQ